LLFVVRRGDVVVDVAVFVAVVGVDHINRKRLPGKLMQTKRTKLGQKNGTATKKQSWLDRDDVRSFYAAG